jgi:hypothetical protein
MLPTHDSKIAGCCRGRSSPWFRQATCACQTDEICLDSLLAPRILLFKALTGVRPACGTMRACSRWGRGFLRAKASLGPLEPELDNTSVGNAADGR